MEKLTYEEIKDEQGKVICMKRSDGWFIPIDEGNADYQRYLNPEAEQSTPIVMENLTEDQ
jgi:hypothetical protein